MSVYIYVASSLTRSFDGLEYFLPHTPPHPIVCRPISPQITPEKIPSLIKCLVIQWQRHPNRMMRNIKVRLLRQLGHLFHAIIVKNNGSVSVKKEKQFPFLFFCFWFFHCASGSVINIRGDRIPDSIFWAYMTNRSSMEIKKQLLVMVWYRLWWRSQLNNEVWLWTKFWNRTHYMRVDQHKSNHLLFINGVCVCVFTFLACSQATCAAFNAACRNLSPKPHTHLIK